MKGEADHAKFRGPAVTVKMAKIEKHYRIFSGLEMVVWLFMLVSVVIGLILITNCGFQHISAFTGKSARAVFLAITNLLIFFQDTSVINGDTFRTFPQLIRRQDDGYGPLPGYPSGNTNGASFTTVSMVLSTTEAVSDTASGTIAAASAFGNSTVSSYYRRAVLITADAGCPVDHYCLFDRASHCDR